MSKDHSAANGPQQDVAGPDKIRTIVVVGRDEALWLAAGVLHTSFFRTGLKIVAVELPSMLRSSDVIPTLPQHAAFLKRLGIAEDRMLAFAKGTYSLGQRFSNFANATFIHGYGASGTPINRVPFHQYWVKARAMGLKAEYDDFSLNAVAARQGVFFRPDEETEKLGESDYAYHLSAVPYCQMLKQVVLAKGIGHFQAARLGDVSQASDTGDITALSLSNGEVIEGDLFIDATGAESLLLGQEMNVDFQSWAHWFPCDRLLTTSGPALAPLPSFSQVSAHRSGWIGQFPLRDRTAIRQVYTGAEMSDQQALDSAAILTPLRPDAETLVTPYTVGRRAVAWSGNCIGIGEAAMVFDPIDNVGSQAILMGLAHLTSLVPLDRNMAAERDEYNLNVISAAERIRDYQMCHYKLNKRFDQPLWDHCRDMTLPDLLAHKLDLFGARGHLVEYNDETFIDYEWWSMLIGHGLIPREPDPVADQVPDAEVISRFQSTLGAIKNRIMWMKPMEAHLKA